MLRLTSVVLLFALAASAQSKPTSPSKPAPSPETVYRNTAFGFRFRVPYGWVERTKEMQGDYDVAQGEVLLAVFERPPQAAGDSVNAAVVIADQPAPNDPALKSATDYLGTLTEMTTASGFKVDGDPSEVAIDSRRLARADFSKALSEKVTMHQTTLVMLAKGKMVLFTFVADNSTAVDDMIERLDFSAARAPAPAKK